MERLERLERLRERALIASIAQNLRSYAVFRAFRFHVPHGSMDACKGNSFLLTQQAVVTTQSIKKVPRDTLNAVDRGGRMPTKNRRVQVSLTADLERRLTLWAYTRDERLPNWIKTVLRLRVDEHWPKIQAALKERAERLGMPVEELERRILEQSGFDFSRELQELEIDTSEDDEA